MGSASPVFRPPVVQASLAVPSAPAALTFGLSLGLGLGLACGPGRQARRSWGRP